MKPLTADDFASVPWGTVAASKKGRRAVRIPEHSTDDLPWLIEGQEWPHWISDEDMAGSKEWTIPLTVTTAREALDAAWELAYEPEGGVIPAGSGTLMLDRNGNLHVEPPQAYCFVPRTTTIAPAPRRLLDPPAPKPEPEPDSEPWETAPFVICDDGGDVVIAARWGLPDSSKWFLPGRREPLTRDEIAEMNPRPFDPSEVQE